MSVCLVAGGRKKGTEREKRELGRRGREVALIGKVKRQGACQGVTHAPQGWVLQGKAGASHSCLLSGTDHWAGVCQNFFISLLLTVKTARWSVGLRVIKCFLL